MNLYVYKEREEFIIVYVYVILTIATIDLTRSVMTLNLLTSRFTILWNDVWENPY